jgi:hypothetical protein
MNILPDAKTKITIIEQAYRLKVQDPDVLAKIAREALARAKEAERRLVSERTAWATRPIRDVALDVIEAIGGDREFWSRQNTGRVEHVISREIASATNDVMGARLHCGHPVACGETDEEGTLHCAWCASLEQARKEGREQWCMPAEWNPLMEALAGLYEAYYSNQTDDGVLDRLRNLMEIYGEWLK